MITGAAGWIHGLWKYKFGDSGGAGASRDILPWLPVLRSRSRRCSPRRCRGGGVCVDRLVIGVPVAHFFLFCNVFRISRPLELLWAGVFLILAGSTVVWNAPGWPATVIVSACVAVAVVVAEMRKPSYHGVGWRRINPRLPEWWAENGPLCENAEPIAGSDGG